MLAGGCRTVEATSRLNEVCARRFLTTNTQDEREMSIPHTYNDGGRALAGIKGSGGDCAARALAIAVQLPYLHCVDLINQFAKTERKGKRKRGISSGRHGVYMRTFKTVMRHLGWTWVPTMQIGSGCKVHLRPEELPPGRIIVNLSRHFAAVIDGVLHDTYDCSRGGTRCVYGYWAKPD